MKKSFLVIWYHQKARRAFQRRKMRSGYVYLKKLVRVAPCMALRLVIEAALKIIIPLKVRNAVTLWCRKRFCITPPFYREVKACGINQSPRDEKVVVSLTSYPKRIGTVHKTINTLLNQTYKPDVIVLWLAPEQFPNREHDLPPRLLALKRYGLAIKWCHDIRSFKKLIPALKEHPNAVLVTADDDEYYPPTWLEKLINTHHRYPGCIVCHNAHRIVMEDDGRMAPYNNWRHGVFSCKPSLSLLQVGCGGVLYEPGSLKAEVMNEELFMSLCPFADDIWFWAMAVLNGTPIKVVDQRIKKIYSIYEADNSAALATLNMMEGNRNDVQLAKVLQAYPELLSRIKESYGK